MFFSGVVFDDVDTNGGSTTEVYKSEFILCDNPPYRSDGSKLCLLGDF